MTKKKHYAHTKEGRPPEEWQPLDEHLSRPSRARGLKWAIISTTDDICKLCNHPLNG